MTEVAPPQRTTFAWRRRLARMAAMLVGLWLVLTVTLWLGQEWLLFPAPAAPIGEPFAPQVRVQAVQVPVAPGLALRGWLARPESAPPDQRMPILLYFGGNAEEVSGVVGWVGRLSGWSVLAVNYRGYGGNPGSPGEPELMADALAIHDWVVHRGDVDPTVVAIAGRSLGSGVALHVAAERPVRAVVLITPYDSIAAVARRRFPYLPTDLLLRHRFDSLARAARVTAPALLVLAGRDSVVPPAHGEALAAGWRGEVEVLSSSDSSHANVLGDPQVWAAMRRLLAK
ncbi:MAG: alpha/beta hydrolase [Deltaproteobacteria bacterium]|nr:alpha/beta hydrolase [Deltaproteobacteria bacterium]